MARFVFSFSWRTLRFAPRLVNRTFGADMHPKGAYNMCTEGARIYAHAWRTLRSHDFDTITCVRRCERAVMFFVTSLRFGRGACVRACDLRRTLRIVHVHVHMCALSGTHVCVRMCARSPARTCVSVCMWHVHVSAPCGCVISFSKRTLRFAPRLVKPPEGWGPLRSQNSIIFLIRYFGISSRARARPRNENDVHATKNRGKWVSKEQNPENEGNFRKNP